MSLCIVTGCANPLIARGFCHMHYKRWRRDGAPGPASKHVPAHAILREWVEQRDRASGCWDDVPWKARTKEGGYPALVIKGKYVVAHRLVMELDGQECPGIPFPKGPWEVLHSCDNKACVNPAHIRWGTRSENLIESFERGLRDRTPPWVKDPSKSKWASR